jgi:hypothetical protein
MKSNSEPYRPAGYSQEKAIRRLLESLERFAASPDLLKSFGGSLPPEAQRHVDEATTGIKEIAGLVESINRQGRNPVAIAQQKDRHCRAALLAIPGRRRRIGGGSTSLKGGL